MSLSNNSLDTFTNLIKLYVDEIVNTNVFTLQNYIFVQFWVCAMMYSLFRYLEGNNLTKLEKDTFQKLTNLKKL